MGGLESTRKFTWGSNTKRESRPGSPLADIAFNLLIADVLHELHSFLLNNDEFQLGCAAVGVTTPPIAWMDDIAIPLATFSASALVPLVREVLLSS